LEGRNPNFLIADAAAYGSEPTTQRLKPAQAA